MRTARGAGRFAADFLAGGRFLVVVLRLRELAVFFTPEREEEVVLLRDAGGEDVRVAMTPNLGDRPTRHRDHRAVCLARRRTTARRRPRVPACPHRPRPGPRARPKFLRPGAADDAEFAPNLWTARIPAL
ncbi:hypothetical protein GCM10022263_30830 [Nocardioides daeguensis]|uniref:Uncharacterized protein n=1 Tax=Nocardioides daeguensis TaxID=908359 RepID=A0ABP6VYQ8_9ACTN